jgi:hypothetical protein
MRQSNTLQCYLHTASYRPLETRSRLRFDCTLHPLNRHLAIYACDTRQLVLVGASDM